MLNFTKHNFRIMSNAYSTEYKFFVVVLLFVSVFS